MECKICDRKYHYCSSCYADRYMFYGYCSEKCWHDSAEYKRNRSMFRAFIISLDLNQKRAFKQIWFDGKYEEESYKWFAELKTEGKFQLT